MVLSFPFPLRISKSSERVTNTCGKCTDREVTQGFQGEVVSQLGTEGLRGVARRDREGLRRRKQHLSKSG